ncbi:hypothetical protein F4778DRAFT_220447 [Xylariomycetidae sp. FL2044]|nr:hypothetical protein F4778DRAFT_220447 [Xylariomycetidae sp. FL2044]
MKRIRCPLPLLIATQYVLDVTGIVYSVSHPERFHVTRPFFFLSFLVFFPARLFPHTLISNPSPPFPQAQPTEIFMAGR